MYDLYFKSNVDYIIITDDNYYQLIDLLEDKSLLGFDTETDVKTNKNHFMQFYSPDSDKTFIFTTIYNYLEDLLDRCSKWKVIGHNLQFDIGRMYKNYGKHPIPVLDTFFNGLFPSGRNEGSQTLNK